MNSSTDAVTATIRGYLPGRSTAEAGRAFVARRPWSPQERAVVLQRFVSRLCIAVQAVMCGVILGILTIGTLSVLAALAPVFAAGLIACMVYAAVVMASPTRNLVHTFRPIHVLDGYVRWRPADASSPLGSNGYAAALSDERTLICEWPTLGRVPLPARTTPALLEFSVRGGLHRIDGAPAVKAARPKAEREGFAVANPLRPLR